LKLIKVFNLEPHHRKWIYCETYVNLTKLESKKRKNQPSSFYSMYGTEICFSPNISIQGWTGHCGNCNDAFFWECKAFFLRMRGIIKIFSENLRLFKLIWGFFKDFNSFLRHFRRNWDFFSINVRVFQRLRGFLNTLLVELKLFQSDLRL
jgi:hypothetical protein